MPRFETRKHRSPFVGRPYWTVGAALLISTILLMAACSSDDPSAVGVGLVDSEIDALLEAMDFTELSSFRQIPIGDTDVPLWDQEVLYLGEQGGSASSILMQYDLDSVLDETITLDMFTNANIATVNFRLLMLSVYAIPDTTLVGDPSWATFYELFHLDAPIDSTMYPGEDPSTVGLPNLNTNYIKEDAQLVQIPVNKGDFISWMNDGGLHAFLLQEGAGSEPGLVGYSSMDMKHGGTTLDPTADTDVLGFAINVKLAVPDTIITISPTLDISTFHTVITAPVDPSDGFFMRTGLRSYPALHFDFSRLPEDIFINRAVLEVVNDTTSSWGTLESIVVSELDLDLFGAEGDTLTLDELEGAIYSVRGMTSLDPTLHRILGFNVTTAVQRIVNGVYEGTRGFILTPGEDFLPSYDTTSLDPDFYFNQFNFFGTADPDTLLRPRLKITYTVNETIQGGGK